MGVYPGGGGGSTLDFKRWGGANGDKLIPPKKSLRLEAKPPKKSFAPLHNLKSGVPLPRGKWVGCLPLLNCFSNSTYEKYSEEFGLDSIAAFFITPHIY